MVGIDREIQTRMDAANNNPQAAMQRYGQSKSVLDLISAQLLANQNAEADNAIKAMFTGSNQTELQRLNQKNAASAQNDVMRAIMPGVAQKAARDQQAMQRRAMGIPSQPAPNMRMADGGIVGFKKGAPILGDRPTPQGQPKMGSVSPKAVDSDQIKQFAELYKDLETSIANATDPKEKSTLENALRDLITQIQTTKQLPYVMQYIDSTQGVVQPRTPMADGGVVALREGGGILSRIIDYIRNIDFGGTSREADQFNKEVTQALNERNMEDTGIMAMVRPVDRPVGPTRPPETMTVPTRGEQFSQMFPDVRKAVNESEGTEMGGIKYLQMIGEMQAKAKEDEARRALNYIKMMASSQDMIDAADPAANIPKFAGPEGSLVGADDDTGRRRAESIMETIGFPLPTDEERARFDEYGVNPYSGRDAVATILSGLTGFVGSEGRQRMAQDQRRAELQEQYPDLSYNQIDNLLRVEIGQEIAGQEPSEPKKEKTGGTMPDAFNVASMVKDLGKPQEKSEEFRMKGVTDAGKQEEPVAARRGLAGLLDKIEENADMSRLRAFLRGGAGQTSVANALAAADRGLAAEDLRQRQLDIQETDVLGRISASRYGSELDYRAALANLRQDEREMIFDAQTDMLKERFKADAQAVSDAMGRLENDPAYQDAFIRLAEQFKDQPALLGAELAAVASDIAARDVDTQKLLRGGEGGGAFSTNIPETGVE